VPLGFFKIFGLHKIDLVVSFSEFLQIFPEKVLSRDTLLPINILIKGGNMHKALFAIVYSFLLIQPLSAFAAGLSAEKEACAKALDTAYDKVLSLRNSSANNVATSSDTSSQQQNKSGGESPISQMMNQMAQNNQQMAEIQKQEAELKKQQMEQMRQVDTEQYKQMMEVEDKIHEFQRQDYERRIKIRDAEAAKKKEEAKMRIACQAKAEGQYLELITNNNKAAVKTNYAVNSLSKARGTKNRMRSMRKVYYSKCMSDPSTQEGLQMLVDELDSKLGNLKIKQEEILSDVAYQKAKVPKMLAHMDEQRRYVSEVGSMQEQALKAQADAMQQQQQMQMMGMAFGLLTSSANSGERLQSAGNVNSADEILNSWDNFKLLCLNDDQRAMDVPSDLTGIFSEVNRKCRPSSVENPQNGCVRNNGKPSSLPRPGTAATS
jgi:hypothetical protein